MFIRRCHIMTAIPALALLTASQTLADSPTPATKVARTTKSDLNAASFHTIHTLVRPHENEWRHLKVKWLTDVVAARKQAAAEDKPIVICYTGGAGYNEPLGVC